MVSLILQCTDSLHVSFQAARPSALNTTLSKGNGYLRCECFVVFLEEGRVLLLQLLPHCKVRTGMKMDERVADGTQDSGTA